MKSRKTKAFRAMRGNERIIERFWSRVEKSETADGCWEWTGRRTPTGYPSFLVGQVSIAPSHVTWFMNTGDVPLGGRILCLCKNPLCVRPSHLTWQIGRVTERRLSAETEGYSSTPALGAARKVGAV